MQAPKINDLELKDYFKEYLNEYREILLSQPYERQLIDLSNRLREFKGTKSKVIIVGNGASASIASHAATDFTQHAGIRCIALNDHNLITAFSNDYGYENWVVKALECYADEGDVVVLVSSSGRSRNIINAARYCKNRRIVLITLSGFDEDNPLRLESDLSLWAPSRRYNVVETIHLFWILQIAASLEGGGSPQLGDFARQARGFVKLLCNDGLYDNLVTTYKVVLDTHLKDGRLIFVGNGGGASLASHAAVDFRKQSGIRTFSFNDHNLITCYANDYGQENWVSAALNAYARREDTVILISTSGQSVNLVKASEWCFENSIRALTLTGMNSKNRLSLMPGISIQFASENKAQLHPLFAAFVMAICDALG